MTNAGAAGVQVMPGAATLAPYACHPSQSKGRRIPEPAAPTRSDFQRDRDRIVHSTAFRRLIYKTQVFVNHEGDLFRTRLTHSLEVAQLGRSIARSMGLNEDLVEAIALAHDLGHTPFGHAGQDALNACMAASEGGGKRGGFEHNLQSLRVVDNLEERYAAFDGLNLCFETREGILKHCSVANAKRLEAHEPGGVGQRFLLKQQPSLEAQLCNLADEIAYNAHDIDDGVRSGLIAAEQLEDLPLVQRNRLAAVAEFPQLVESPRRWLYETIRRMLSEQVYDVIAASQAALRAVNPADVDAVRRLPPLMTFSATMRREADGLKRWLMRSLYRHPQVVATMEEAKAVVQALFDAYMADPAQMQKGFAARVASHPSGAGSSERDAAQARVVADYIAGMTDRFALREAERLTGRVIRF